MTAHLADDVELRRVLRPAAWTVWTAVLGHANLRADGSWFAAVSLRSLAAELGLAKDTVAGCMQRLVHHGLVDRCPQAHAHGRFVAGGYIVRPVAAISGLDPVHPATIPTVTSSTYPDLDQPPAPPPLPNQDPRLPSPTPSSPRPTRPPTTALAQLSFLTDL